MSEPTSSFWQWAAQGASAAVLFLGALVMRDWKSRLSEVERAHRKLVTQDYLDRQLEVQAEERRWMHEQNSERFKQLTERLDKVLDQ
jgi:hypothetical protein